MITIAGLKTLLSGAWQDVRDPVALQSQKTPFNALEKML